MSATVKVALHRADHMNHSRTSLRFRAAEIAPRLSGFNGLFASLIPAQPASASGLGTSLASSASAASAL